jgi:hypothetical protein
MINAALRRGFVDTLVADENTAKALLAMFGGQAPIKPEGERDNG